MADGGQQVTIRLLPARHAAAVTVLVRTPAATELYALNEDGTRAPRL